jgi:hypothetical protein
MHGSDIHLERPREVEEVAAAMPATVIGELIAITNEGCSPLVVYPGQPGSAALAARTLVDLPGSQIGRKVLLMFEGSNPTKPILIGVLREDENSPLVAKQGVVEVDADGQRLMITAKEQLVLRCGKASVTLTKAGKILIHGTYVSMSSSGVVRVKGGSIQLN